MVLEISYKVTSWLFMQILSCHYSTVVTHPYGFHWASECQPSTRNSSQSLPALLFQFANWDNCSMSLNLVLRHMWTEGWCQWGHQMRSLPPSLQQKSVGLRVITLLQLIKEKNTAFCFLFCPVLSRRHILGVHWYSTVLIACHPRQRKTSPNYFHSSFNSAHIFHNRIMEFYSWKL